jgi:hypothetical protein
MRKKKYHKKKFLKTITEPLLVGVPPVALSSLVQFASFLRLELEELQLAFVLPREFENRYDQPL